MSVVGRNGGDPAMYSHILVATDGSPLAAKAVTHGLSLARALGARVTAVTVTEPWATVAPPEVLNEPFVQGFEQAANEEAKRILDSVEAAAKAAGVACSVSHVRDRFPAEGILEATASSRADLIVMASHGRRGLAKFLLGSQATEVLTHSTVPVLICR
jgi:nucleotide-binding universal stress UspA family protein